MSEAPKRVIISVISDLVTDQRVNRQAMTLTENGYLVTLVGRKMKKSLPVSDRSYKITRFRLLFETGPLFYAEINIRLFFYLLFHKADVFLSNDLDTLLPNFLVSKLKNVKLVYDSHEYFTEVPELVNRPFIRSIWSGIERWIFPRLRNPMTVNSSIAAIYSSKYKIPVEAVRNLPARADLSIAPVTRKEWGIPENAKIFLFQGAGINIDRGAEESIDSIALVPGAVLLFVGGGDVIDHLKKRVEEKGMKDKVFFIPKQPMKDLIRFTRMADFGLTLDKSNNLNYKYSLPNKLFDYIQANLPVLATNLVEVKYVVEKYNIGVITLSTEPEILAEKMKYIMADENRIASWKKNLNIAANELCWENEQQKFLKIFSDAGA